MVRGPWSTDACDCSTGIGSKSSRDGSAVLERAIQWDSMHDSRRAEVGALHQASTRHALPCRQGCHGGRVLVLRLMLA